MRDRWGFHNIIHLLLDKNGAYRNFTEEDVLRFPIEKVIGDYMQFMDIESADIAIQKAVREHEKKNSK